VWVDFAPRPKIISASARELAQHRAGNIEAILAETWCAWTHGFWCELITSRKIASRELVARPA
jgi:hypothetical protein